MNDFTWALSLDRDRFQLDRVYEWLRNSYWSPHVRRDVLERAFANSLVIGAYDDAGIQVGVARAVTDFASFGWLCDVYVDEAWRGRGIGKAMVRALVDDDRLQTLRRWMLGTQDAHTVYEEVGFEDVESGRYMKLVRDPSTWQRLS